MTDQPTPETDDFRPCHLTPSDWPAFARALERERNAARAERDELNRQLSVALKGKRPYSSEFADETIAAQVKRIVELEEKLNGWFSERGALLAERDAANALTLSLCADMDGDVQNRDDEIAVLRADVARLREAIVQTIAEGGNELPEWVEAKLEKALAALAQ
jgi:hypothetical protein